MPSFVIFVGIDDIEINAVETRGDDPVEIGIRRSIDELLPAGFPIADLEIFVPIGVLAVEPRRSIGGLAPFRAPVVAIGFGFPDADIGDDALLPTVGARLHACHLLHGEGGLVGAVRRVIDDHEIDIELGDLGALDVLQLVGPTGDRCAMGGRRWHRSGGRGRWGCGDCSRRRQGCFRGGRFGRDRSNRPVGRNRARRRARTRRGRLGRTGNLGGTGYRFGMRQAKPASERLKHAAGALAKNRVAARRCDDRHTLTVGSTDEDKAASDHASIVVSHVLTKTDRRRRG